MDENKRAENRERAEETRQRIQKDIDHYKGDLPESWRWAWQGYIAALIEWGLLEVSDHADLTTLIDVDIARDENPVLGILLGRDNE